MILTNKQVDQKAARGTTRKTASAQSTISTDGPSTRFTPETLTYCRGFDNVTDPLVRLWYDKTLAIQ